MGWLLIKSPMERDVNTPSIISRSHLQVIQIERMSLSCVRVDDGRDKDCRGEIKERYFMKIIVLAGPNSCGKTTILNNVYDVLLAQGAVSAEPAGKKQIVGKDFSDIVTWKGKKIAIFTMGDYSYKLIGNRTSVGAVADYAIQNCDIMISACNTRLIKPFKVFKQAQYNTTRVDKIRITEKNRLLRPKVDMDKAQTIVGELEMVLKNLIIT